MPRGYRSIILALGLTLSAASPPGHGGQREQTHSQTGANQSLHEIAAALQNANEANEANKPCAQNQENRSSDLCAQWKAADSAEASAHWAHVALWIDIVGGVIGLLTLIAAAAAAKFAHDAAVGAQGANILTRKAQRPWLDFEIKTEDWKTHGGDGIWIKIVITNHSDFPAHAICAAGEGYFHSGGLLSIARSPETEANVRKALAAKSGNGGAAFPHKEFTDNILVEFVDPHKIRSKPGSPPAKMLIGIRYEFDGGYGETFIEYDVTEAKPFIDWLNDPSIPRIDVYGVSTRPLITVTLDPSSVNAT